MMATAKKQPGSDASTPLSAAPARPRAKRSVTADKPAAAKKTAAPLTAPVSSSPDVPVVAAPETTKAGANLRKRLSKAFSRPLDKKLKKETLVRDRFTFPEAEYAQLALMKKRLSNQEISVKKSQLVRAGLILLSALDDDNLKAIVLKLPAAG